MKNIIFLFIIALIVSCSSSKKVIREQTVSQKLTETKETTTLQEAVRIDTTKVSDFETTYTRIEYFEPISPANSDTVEHDPVLNTVKKPPANIKSIETLTIKKKTEVKGEAESVQEKTIVVHQAIEENTETEMKSVEKSKPVQLKYLFYILLLIAGAYLFFTKGSILKKIFRF
ncbi:MAG: hypothetical protein ACK5JD_10720 [Mangrovibacterium sp.]